jgi:hypothetical protein
LLLDPKHGSPLFYIRLRDEQPTTRVLPEAIRKPERQPPGFQALMIRYQIVRSEQVTLTSCCLLTLFNTVRG